jgi:hypothetical protein
LERAGAEGIRSHMKDTLARLAERPKLDVQLARGRSTNAEPETNVTLAFLRMPGEPVRAMGGTVAISGAEVSAPQIDVRNVGSQPVRYLELGLILKDDAGNEIYAGAVPGEVNLAPGQHARIQQQATLKVTQRAGRAGQIAGLTGFVNHVEFADGRLWIPERAALEDQGLRRSLQPSAEEQRLADLYRRKGLNAVLDEIARF